MQKIYIGKDTNSVSQIIQEDFPRYDRYHQETFGTSFYMIEVDDEHHLDSHNYFYDAYTGQFEKIEGITALDHIASEDEPSETQKLRKENEELKQRLEYIESILNINSK